jgi:hypothetical protein
MSHNVPQLTLPCGGPVLHFQFFILHFVYTPPQLVVASRVPLLARREATIRVGRPGPSDATSDPPGSLAHLTAEKA